MWMLEKVIEHGSAKRCKRERSWKSKFSYSPKKTNYLKGYEKLIIDRVQYYLVMLDIIVIELKNSLVWNNCKIIY